MIGKSAKNADIRGETMQIVPDFADFNRKPRILMDFTDFNLEPQI